MFGQTRQLRDRVDFLQWQVRELEELVKQLAERADVGEAELLSMRGQVEPGITPQIRQLVAEDRHIEAIKAYRQQTGAGLKDAKDAIDALHDRQR